MTSMLLLTVGDGPISQRTNAVGSTSPSPEYATGGSIESGYLSQHANLSTSAAPPPGSLPVPKFFNYTANLNSSRRLSSSDADLVNGLYVGASGYQTLDQGKGGMYAYTTYIELAGSASSLGSNTISAGLNIHVSDGTYAGVDYLLQFYLYYTSNGEANTAVVVYAACTWVFSTNCGPQYNCHNLCTLATNMVSDIGKSTDNIQLIVYWNTQYGYTFDYKDLNNNPYSWTVATLYPSDNYVTMKHEDLGIGQIHCKTFDGLNGCNPVDYAYWVQIGAWFNGVPQNTNWQFVISNTQYKTTSSSSWTYLNHAQTMYWDYNNGDAVYYSYWKDLWVVGSGPAQYRVGVFITGSGSSSYNSIDVDYQGGSQGGDVNLW